MKKQLIQKLGLLTMAMGFLGLNLRAESWHKEDRSDDRWVKHEKRHHWDERHANDWRAERGWEHKNDFRYYGPSPRTEARFFFSVDDRRYLFDYYRCHDRHYWARRYPANLSPGLYKQLVRNGHLPPGLERQLAPFPYEVERRLYPLPRNYFRFMLGGKGLIVDAQFNIVDVMDLY